MDQEEYMRRLDALDREHTLKCAQLELEYRRAVEAKQQAVMVRPDLQALLQQPVENLRIATQAEQHLIHVLNLVTIGDLVAIPPEELTAINGFGYAALTDVERAVSAVGLRLGLPLSREVRAKPEQDRPWPTTRELRKLVDELTPQLPTPFTVGMLVRAIVNRGFQVDPSSCRESLRRLVANGRISRTYSGDRDPVLYTVPLAEDRPSPPSLRILPVSGGTQEKSDES